MHTVSHHLFFTENVKVVSVPLVPNTMYSHYHDWCCNCACGLPSSLMPLLVGQVLNWHICREREREREIIYNKIKWFFNLNIDTGKWTGCWFLRLTSKLILTETPAHAHAHPQTNKHIHTLKHTHKVMFVSQYSEVIS